MKARDWSCLLLPLAAVVAPAAYATDYMSVAQAQTALFPGAKRFVDVSLKLNEEQRDRIKSLAGVRQRWDEQKVWRVERDDGAMGWLLIDQVIGKHEFITYATAISPEGRVLGVEILTYLETHGGQVREASWRKQFAGKTLADKFKLDEDVPNISGATLSCRNVLDGVKRLLVVHKLFLAKS